MVIFMFGWFSKGKMDIKIHKFNYTPGETITGTVMMNLKKPLEGRGVYIRLLGTEQITEGYGKNRRTRTITIFNFKQPLDGEKTYTSSPLMYDFEIMIPEDIFHKPQSPELEGVLGTALKAAEFLSKKRSTIRWHLIANLDVPGFDLKKKLQINIA